MDWHWQDETVKDAISVERVSSKGQEDNTSLDFQASQIQRYCAECSLVIKHSFRLVESAKDAHSRKGYKKAIEFALKNKIKHVVFYMNDRESRNMTDIERNNQHIKAGRIVVHHVHDRRVYWKGSSPNDFFMRNIGASVSQLYVDNLAVKIRSGQQGKVEQGWYPYSKLPLGYMWQRDLNSQGKEQRRGLAKIVPDTDLSRLLVVRKEFELRAIGLSAEAIRAKVIEMGLKPASDKSYDDWGIEKRLKNKFYWGYFDFQGQEFKGRHPLIIPQDILDKVAESFNMKRFTPKSNNADALLSNWIRCGHPGCGMAIVYAPKTKAIGKIYRYYRCSNSRMVHENQKGLCITEEAIFDQFTPMIRNITISSQRAKEILEAIQNKGQEEQESLKALAKNNKREIEDIKKREIQAYQDFSSGLIDREIYTSLTSELKEERQRLQRQLDKSNSVDESNLMEYARKLVELCKNAEFLWKEASRQSRAELVKQLCLDPTLTNGTLRYDLEKSFQIISEMRETRLWWRLGGSNS